MVGSCCSLCGLRPMGKAEMIVPCFVIGISCMSALSYIELRCNKAEGKVEGVSQPWFEKTGMRGCELERSARRSVMAECVF